MDKVRKKQLRSRHLLEKHEGIIACEEPTVHIYVANGGLINGVSADDLREIFGPHATCTDVCMRRGKAYAFVSFSNVEDSQRAFDNIQGRLCTLSSIAGQGVTLYLSYVQSVPDQGTMTGPGLSPGLTVYPDFVTPEYEEELLASLRWGSTLAEEESTLKQRQVQHFGYEFKYGSNDVDPDHPLTQRPLPAKCELLVRRFQDLGLWRGLPPDQLTVNQYLPGQGIPPHVDTHSAFADEIVSLSLGSSAAMEFKKPAAAGGDKAEVMLPRRCLCVMDGESRYLWSHSIPARKHDVTPEGSMTSRDVRTSFTFRRLRRGPCHCDYPEECDSQRRQNKPNAGEESGAVLASSDAEAWKLEEQHVHQVYEEIADHFSGTRHSPWPRVRDFVMSVPPGGVMVDVGCGNGKYLGLNSSILQLGTDRSAGLARICAERGHECVISDVLHLPLREACCDAVICIAVLHHLATQDRRAAGVRALCRLLRPRGTALITVWALEQQEGSGAGDYVKPGRLPASEDGATADVPRQLPVHVNRTNFQAQDVLVPWKLKQPAKRQEGATPTDKQSCRRKDKRGKKGAEAAVASQLGASEVSSETGAASVSSNVAVADSSSSVADKSAKGATGTCVTGNDGVQEKQGGESSTAQTEGATGDGDKSCAHKELGVRNVAKGEETFHRYYHVFRQGELESLCAEIDGISILESYYDKGNWAVILQKEYL